MLRKLFIISFTALFMTGCVTTTKSPNAAQSEQATEHKPSLAEMSELTFGKRLFEQSDYKRAMKQLLPLAARGNPEAQYAVGYMYYYGYGINRDEESGKFWIESSAKQHYAPAIKAMEIMQINQSKKQQKQEAH